MIKSKTLNEKIDFIIESLEMMICAEDILKATRESIAEIIEAAELKDKLTIDEISEKDIWMGVITNTCLRWATKKKIPISEFGRHLDLALRAEFLRRLMKEM